MNREEMTKKLATIEAEAAALRAALSKPESTDSQCEEDLEGLTGAELSGCADD